MMFQTFPVRTSSCLIMFDLNILCELAVFSILASQKIFFSGSARIVPQRSGGSKIQRESFARDTNMQRRLGQSIVML